MLVIRSLTIAAILLFFNCSSAFSQPRYTTNRHSRQSKCEPIAQVINTGDRYFSPGSYLCVGDRLQPEKGAIVKVLCYVNPSVLSLGSGIVSDKCAPPSKQYQAQQCTPQNRNNCRKRKGAGEEKNAPTLIIPYTSTILNIRPSISWYAVTGATSYTVQLSGEGINWEKTVSSTTLTYSKESPALEYGNVYKLTVIAKENDSPLAYSSSVLIMSPLDEVRQITATVKQIQDLRLSPDQTAFNLNVVYRSENLLTEAISILKARIKAGSQNPTIYRVLGDRYLEAGLPDSALQEYKSAAKLAQKADNDVELALAQAGLKLAALYNQVPTRINPDQ